MTACAVVFFALLFILLELAGESWFVKWWIIQPAMRSVGVIVNMGRLEYSLLTGDFSIKGLEWSNSIYDGNQVAIEGGTESLEGRITIDTLPWSVFINKAAARGAHLKLTILSDAECRWARGEDYVLPPLPPPYAAPEPPDFMWEMPAVLPRRTKGAPLGKPWFVPDVTVRDLAVDEASLFVEWHHDYGGREYMRINDISLEMDECSPGLMGNMVFAASGGSYESEYVNLYSAGLTGSSRLTLGRDGYLDVETWQSELNDFRSVFFGVEWPNSKLAVKGRSDGLNWYFDRVSGTSCLDDGQGAFELSGLIAPWGFLVFPGSTIRCDREAVNEWFPQFAVEDIIWDIAISGGGDFEKPCFSLDMSVANPKELPYNFSCHSSFKLGTDIYNETVWLRGFFLQASESVDSGEGRENINFLQAAFTGSEFAGYGFGADKFLNDNTLLIQINEFPAGGINQLCGLPEDSPAALKSGGISGTAFLELKKGSDVPETFQCRIAAEDITTRSPDILAEPAEAVVEFDLKCSGMDLWELTDIRTHLADGSGTILRAGGQGTLLPEEMNFKCTAGINEFRPAALGFAGKEGVQKILELFGIGTISMKTSAEISPAGINVESLTLSAPPFTAEMHPFVYDFRKEIPETSWHVGWNGWRPGRIKEPVSGDFTLNVGADAVRWRGEAEWSGWRGASAGGFDFRDMMLRMESIDVRHADFGRWQAGNFAAAFGAEGPIFREPVELSGEIEPAKLAGIISPLKEVRGTLKGRAVLASAGEGRYRLGVEVNPDGSDFIGGKEGNIVSIPGFSAVAESDTAGDFTASGEITHGGIFELESKWRASGQFPDFAADLQIDKLLVPQLEIESREGRIDFASRGGEISVRGEVPFGLQGTVKGRSVVEIISSGGALEVKDLSVNAAGNNGERLIAFSAKGGFGDEGINIDASAGFSVPLLEEAIDGDKLKGKTEEPAETAAQEETADAGEKDGEKGKDHLEDVFISFGPRPIRVNMTLDGCEIMPEYILDGKIEFKARDGQASAVSREMTLNDGKIEVKLDGNDLDSPGKNIRFDIQVSDLELGTAGDSKTGVVCENFLFTGRAPLATGNRLMDNMTARCTGDFKDIKINNTFSDSVAGKALMTPLELILRIRSAMPDISREQLGYKGISRDFKDIYAHTDVLRFDRAELAAKTQNGEISLNKCIFSSKIHELRAPGTICWGSRKDIDIKASYCIGSLVIPVSVSGTMEKPEIVWADAVWRVVSENIMEMSRDSVRLIQTLNPWSGTP